MIKNRIFLDMDKLLGFRLTVSDRISTKIGLKKTILTNDTDSAKYRDQVATRLSTKISTKLVSS